MYALEYILERDPGVIIAIGSCMTSHEPKNPFTLGERLAMISAALDDAKISRHSWYAVGIPDVQIHPSWVRITKALSPPFSRVYTNDPLTRVLFKEDGYEVLAIPLLQKDQFSGTEIRRRMLSDEKWVDLVPEATFRLIERIEGVERLRSLVPIDPRV